MTRGTGPEAAYHAHLLSNGPYSVLLSPAGGGYSAFDGLAVTRWLPDAVSDDQGIFVYLRDLDTQRFWSVGRQPAPAEASHGARFHAANTPNEKTMTSSLA